MAKNLLIVESPAKARTINKYLGDDFKVLASYGHVRDLIPKENAVDPDNDFAMLYEISENSHKHVDAIVKAAKKAEAIYLATDLDREGEAISWHVLEVLKERGVLDGKAVHRVVFSEITPRAIRDAVDNPRQVSKELVNAQLARRVLDFLVGFNLSPLLWKKITTGLSAGRVQSPALRMIVDRELEIEQFKPQEYWSVEADLNHLEQDFIASLVEWDGDRLRQFDLNNVVQTNDIRETLLAAAGGKLKVASVTRKERQRRPPPPFITSTLQQDASRKLRFSARQTMRIAQQLYEGMQIEGGHQGLITYMRTDSVSLAAEAVVELRKQISDQFGPEQVPGQANVYKTKSKNAQEAHEAIRPASAKLTPASVKPYLDENQWAMYDLIWKRTMACQMVPALMHTVAVEFGCGTGATFRANGSTIAKPGFLAVYEESRSGGGKVTETRLPAMQQGDVVTLREIRAEQHFTEPPPRFSEASLVKALEEYGIGRPSTYANIISTLVNRKYVELDRRRFVPTDTGYVVARLLSEHFQNYVDYEFTARMEDALDAISRGEEDWIHLMRQFWEPFIKRINEKLETINPDEARQKRILGTDPASGKPISVRLGRYGSFVQIGTRDDEDKPQFASLRPGQKLYTVTLEQALELFKLPRKLGETPDGEPVSANIGRFGPYLRYGSKFVSLKEDDPHTIELARALEIIAAKKQADLDRIICNWEEQGIQILKGRWGPFITDGNKNARIPKDREPESLTLEECQKLIAEAPARKRGRKKTTKKKTAKKKTAGNKTSRKKTAASKSAES